MAWLIVRLLSVNTERLMTATQWRIKALIKVRKSLKPDHVGEFYLFADGTHIDTHSYVRATGIYMSVDDIKESRRLMAYRLSDFPQEVPELSFLFRPDWSELIGRVTIYRDLSQQDIQIGLAFSFDMDNWKSPYGISEFGTAFEEVVEETKCTIIQWMFDDEIMAGGFEVRVQIPEPQEFLEIEVLRVSDVVRELNERVETLLASRSGSDSVVMYFDFPEQVRVPCEQYLLYFVQFLRDLGIEATAELQQDGGQVQFAVTPTDVNDTLDKISIALDVFLRLPANPNSDSSADDEIAIQRLSANIHHLKGQLALSRAEIQANEKTIQAQQHIFASHQRLLDAQLSGEIIINSAMTGTPHEAKKDNKELLQGALAITKYKGKGFDLDLAEIFRRLRKLLFGMD